MNQTVIQEPYFTQLKGVPEHYGRGGSQIVLPGGECGYFASGHLMAPLMAAHGQQMTLAWIDFYAKQIESETSDVGKMLRQKMTWYFNNIPNARAGAAVDCHAYACEYFAKQYDSSLSSVLKGPNGSSFAEIKASIDAGFPVGYISNLTHDRHFGCIAGYREDPSGPILIVKDSYGNFHRPGIQGIFFDPASLGKGDCVEYPYRWLAQFSPESRGEMGYLWYLHK